MSPLCPSPQCLVDLVINLSKHLLADHMSVIQTPSLYLGIQGLYQILCGCLTHCSDGLAYISQVSCYILLCWLYYEFGVRMWTLWIILPYVEAQKIEPL